MKVKKQQKQTVFIGFRLDPKTAQELTAKAVNNKRTAAGELRVAVENHLKN